MKTFAPIKRKLKHAVPARVRARVRGFVIERKQPTVAEGWELLARWWDGPEGTHLGDGWHDADVLGVAVAPEHFVQKLDERVFASFLGTVDVLLEIGPGAGRFTEILLPKCRKLIAGDTAPSMLKRLAARFDNTPSLVPLKLDGRTIPLPDASVDAAFSYDVFVHLQHWDFYNYLVELRRVLKPGGKAIIHHANTSSPLGWQKFRSDLDISIGKHKLPTTFTLMTPDLMRMFSEKAGLVLVDCITDVVPRDCIALLTAPSDRSRR